MYGKCLPRSTQKAMLQLLPPVSIQQSRLKRNLQKVILVNTDHYICMLSNKLKYF